MDRKQFPLAGKDKPKNDSKENLLHPSRLPYQKIIYESDRPKSFEA